MGELFGRRQLCCRYEIDIWQLQVLTRDTFETYSLQRT